MVLVSIPSFWHSLPGTVIRARKRSECKHVIVKFVNELMHFQNNEKHT